MDSLGSCFDMANKARLKWLITIANLEDKGLCHKAIADKLNSLSLDYFCMCDEISAKGVYHTHVLIYGSKPIRLSTLRLLFPDKRIMLQPVDCDFVQALAYVRKTGVFCLTNEITLSDTFEQHGATY